MFRVAKSKRVKPFGLATVFLGHFHESTAKLKHKIFSFLIFTTALLAASSCGTERKLAREFVNRNDTISVLLIPPDFLFKTNAKTWMIGDAAGLDEEEKNRLLIDSSKYLKGLDDTLLINRYMNALEATLRKYGIVTYTHDEITGFMNVKKMAFQVTLAQLEAEEGIYDYRPEATFDSTVYYEDFALDQVSLNSWFEISKLNDPEAANNVVYASDAVTEGLDGRFVQNIFTGEVKFNYNRYPLETEEIYTLAAIAGERYAGYLYDYILNRYIFMNFPNGQQAGTYLHYDHDANIFYPAGDDRFIFLDD